MGQNLYLKTHKGQMFIPEVRVISPDGKEFTYSSQRGLMTYNSATGITFAELLDNPWLTEEDRENVKAIERALSKSLIGSK